MTRIRSNATASVVWILAVLVLVLAPSQTEAKVRAFTSISPQAYFVREIGGELVEVDVLVPSGQSPATYEPTPQQMTRLADADLLFTTGVPFEKRLLQKLSNGYDDVKVVETHAGIKLRPIERHDHGEHEHEGMLDPHVWLDPGLAKLQAENICRALIEADETHAQTFESNLSHLQDAIDSAAAAVERILQPVKGGNLFVFHPAYGYFCDAYGLHQVAIETDGKQPSARQLAALVDQAERDRVEVVFVQPQFSRRQAESIGQAIGARIETLDPLSGDYMNNLLDMAGKIARALTFSGEVGGE